jgi:DNA-binding NarL/FixJ family response regulator
MTWRQKAPPTVVIVEDISDVAVDVRQMLERHGFRVVGCTRDKPDEVIVGHRPDLILIDVSRKGTAATLDIVTRLSASITMPIVYLTSGLDEEALRYATHVNTFGYLVTPVDERQLCVTARFAIARGAILLRHPRRARLEQGLVAIAHVLHELGLEERPASNWEVRLKQSTLSRREAEIIHHLVVGRRVPSIARLLALSPHTVRNHLKAAFRKLDVRSQDELLEWVRNS